MNALILDGKAVAEERYRKLRHQIDSLREKIGKVPHLYAILVGNDPASLTYVSAKIKTCEKIGIQSTLKKLPENISENELSEIILSLNEDPEATGILVQLPLPPHISQEKVIHLIHPEKDVDGFHPLNIGRMTLGSPSLVPATPRGILTLLDHYQIDTKGKHCVVIGRSNIVGKPISILLSSPGRDATVTLCHSKTESLHHYTQDADILIVAVGKPHLVNTTMVKPKSVVIDVGIHRIPDPSRKSGYRLIGDVHFDEVQRVASAITPVPGGVGPMTIASLMENTLIAFQIQHQLLTQNFWPKICVK
jgi:methylenetetrahydrofolate dehydrogenase (NADP+)/methenyltetrahydrofolate cyclohydrolase